MLTELKFEEFNNYINWAYELSLDITRSAFPTYTDGVKMKKDFVNTALLAFSSKHSKILLYSNGNTMLGWIHYYLIPEDKYIGLYSFNTEKQTKQALTEFENYCKKNFKGYTLYMGFPSKNADAISYFKENSYELLETSYPHVFHFKQFTQLNCTDKIIKINKENYVLFEILHKCVDSDMYWNTERIFNAFDKWQVYYYDDGNKQGAIYFTDNCLPEIFGVDYSDNKPDLSVFRELIVKCLNVCACSDAEHLYYFAEGTETDILSELGFIGLSKYNCYALCLT